MAFNYKSAKQAGYSDEEISSFLASNHKNFDVQGAVKAGYSLDEISQKLESPVTNLKKTSLSGELNQGWESLGGTTAERASKAVKAGLDYPLGLPANPYNISDAMRKGTEPAYYELMPRMEKGALNVKEAAGNVLGNIPSNANVGAALKFGTGLIPFEPSSFSGFLGSEAIGALKGIYPASKSGAVSSLLKKGASWLFGPSEEAINAALEDPAVIGANHEDVAKSLPAVAQKFDQVITEMNSKAKDTLSKSRFIEKTAEDAGGAFTKDEVLSSVETARRSLGGIYTDEAKSAANTLSRIGENLKKIRNTVSQNQVHDLIMDLDKEIPWDRATRASQDLSKTDSALIKLRNSLDKSLKSKNSIYEKAMKPVEEAIQSRNEFTKKFGLQKVKDQGWTAGDQTLPRVRSALKDSKIDTARVLKRVKDVVGEDVGTDIKKASLGEEFTGKNPDIIAPMAIAGGAVGGGVGGALHIPGYGGGAGAAVGAGIGKYLANRGPEMLGNYLKDFSKTPPRNWRFPPIGVAPSIYDEENP